MCPNLWCNNSKAIFFLAGNLFFFDTSWFFPVKACFLCAICGNVTALSSFAHKYTVQNPLWKRHVCPAFINVMIENSLSHKSSARSTLYNFATNFFPLLLHICICTEPFCFALTWCPSATSINLSISSNDPGMKSVTSVVIWHIAPESKIQLVNCELSNDDVRKNKDYGDSSQLTNWILDSGAMCHLMPEVVDFIPGSLEDTDKFIEVAGGHHVTAKQKWSVRIQMCDDNGKIFIATLYNVLLAPDLCGRLFSIITLMNAGHTCLFHKGFCMV